jgi:hypothetical protein
MSLNISSRLEKKDLWSPLLKFLCPTLDQSMNVTTTNETIISWKRAKWPQHKERPNPWNIKISSITEVDCGTRPA